MGGATSSTGPNLLKVQQLLEKNCSLTPKDQFFWRIAKDKNCPQMLQDVDVLKWDKTLPSIMLLLETLEVEAAVEEAIERDRKLKEPKKGK